MMKYVIFIVSLYHTAYIGCLTIGHNFNISNLKLLIDMIEQYPNTPLYITVVGKVWNIEQKSITKGKLIELCA